MNHTWTLNKGMFVIRNMVEDSGTDEEIPLPNVKTAILSKAISSFATSQCNFLLKERVMQDQVDQIFF